MAIKGFGVSGQDRQRIRKILTGTKDGFAWSVECELVGLFRWRVGQMSGFTPRNSTVGGALLLIQDAIDLQKRLEKTCTRATPEILEQLDRLKRWERMATSGRLRITRKKRTGERRGDDYFLVEEVG